MTLSGRAWVLPSGEIMDASGSHSFEERISVRAMLRSGAVRVWHVSPIRDYPRQLLMEYGLPPTRQQIQALEQYFIGQVIIDTPRGVIGDFSNPLSGIDEVKRALQIDREHPGVLCQAGRHIVGRTL